MPVPENPRANMAMTPADARARNLRRLESRPAFKSSAATLINFLSRIRGRGYTLQQARVQDV